MRSRSPSRALACVMLMPTFSHSAASAPAGVNKLAIASLVCGLAGIPLFGLITGLVAVLLGVLALSAIRASSQRGLWLALAGLMLGIVDVTGWVIFLGMMLTQAGPDLHFAELAPDMSVIRELEPALQRAMRANVLIERNVGPGGARGQGDRLGSDPPDQRGRGPDRHQPARGRRRFPTSADASNDAGRMPRPRQTESQDARARRMARVKSSGWRPVRSTWRSFVPAVGGVE